MVGKVVCTRRAREVRGGESHWTAGEVRETRCAVGFERDRGVGGSSQI